MKKFLALMAILLCFMVLFVACDDEVVTEAPTDAPTEAPTQAPCTHEYDNECDAVCNLCKAEREPAAHVEETLAAVEATCTETGLTEGKKCTVCGVVTKAQEVVPAKGHTEEAIPAVAATCTTTGLTEGKKCTVCGEVTVAQTTVLALGHTVETVEGIAPTCTEAGLTSGKQCTVCEVWVQPQAEIEATGHTELWVGYIEPTCTEPGYYGATICVVCEEVTVEGEEIPALGHVEIEIPAVDATCTKEGATAGVGCEVCGAVIVAPEATEKAPHNEKVVKGYAATCTEAGLTDGSVCADCGAVLVAQESIPAAHGEEVDMEDVLPTCTTIGYVGGKKCADCGAITVAQTVVPITHTYDADCDHECNICGYQRYTMPAHEYEFGNCVYCECVDENYADVEEIITFNEAYNVPFGQDENGNDLYYLGGTSPADSQSVDGFVVPGFGQWVMTGYKADNPAANGIRYDGPIKVASNSPTLDVNLFGWVKWYDMPLDTIGVFVDKIDSVDDITWNGGANAGHLALINGGGVWATNLALHADVMGLFGENARRYTVSLHLDVERVWNQMRYEPGIHQVYVVAKMTDGQLIVVNDYKFEVVDHECSFVEDGTEGVGVVTPPTCTADGFTTVNCLTDAYLCPSTTRINYVDALGHNPADEWTYQAGHHFHECLNGCGTQLDYTECYGEDYQVCDTCNAPYNCAHEWKLEADGTIHCAGACGESWTPATYHAGQSLWDASKNSPYTHNAALSEDGNSVVLTGQGNGDGSVALSILSSNPNIQKYVVVRLKTSSAATMGFATYNPGMNVYADVNTGNNWMIFPLELEGISIHGRIDIRCNVNAAADIVTEISHFASFDNATAAVRYAELLNAFVCDHEIAEIPETAPTCTENGRTVSTACTKCGFVFQAGSLIPATGHSYDNKCDTACNVCDAVREVPAHSTFDTNFDGICEECGVVYLEINYGTADAPISVSDALKYASILTDGKSSLEKYTAIGTVTSIGADKGNYLQNVYITDGENEILIYTINMGEGVEKFAVGDVIVVNGYIKNYKGTIEFASKKVDGENVYVYAVERHTFDNACDTSCNDCGWMREVPQHVDEDANGVCDICSAVQGATQEWPLDLTVGGWGTSTPEFVAGTSLADPGIQQYYYKWVADGEGKFVVAFAPENIVVFVNGVAAEGGAAQVVEGDVVELVVYATSTTDEETGNVVVSTDPVWFNTELAPAGSVNNPFIIEELGWIGTPEFVAGTSFADPGVQEYHYQWIATGEGKVVVPALENIALTVNGDWFSDGKADVVEGDVVDITIYGLMDEEWNLITDPVWFSIELAIAGSEKNPFELTLGQTATPEFVAGTSFADPGVQEYHYAYTATADGLFLYTDAENISVVVNGEWYVGGSVAVVAGDVVEITVYGLMDENYALITDPVYFLTEFAAEGSEKNPFELTIGEFTTPEYVIGTSLADPGVSVYFYEMTATAEITLKVDALEYISVLVNGVYSDSYTVTLAAGDVLTVAVQNPSWTETTPVSFVVTDKVNCEHANTETIPAVDATCGKVGSTEGTKCSDCGATLVAPTEIPATGEHTAADAVVENVVDATCTVGGSYESVVYCSVCGAEMSRETVETDALGHEETAMEDVAPTCTEAGQTGGTKCSVCGEVLTAPEAVEALGHKEETITGTAATCTEAGLTDGVKCSVCGEVLKAQEEIKALGHTEEEIPAVGATCTTNGLTAGVKCSVCGEVLTEQAEIPAGHTYAADCDTDCDVCGEKRETVVEHNFTGVCVQICEDCGANNGGSHIFEYGSCATCGEVDPAYAGLGILSFQEAFDKKWMEGDMEKYYLAGTSPAASLCFDGYIMPGQGQWLMTGYKADNPAANGTRYDGTPIKIASNAAQLDINFFGWVDFGDVALSEFGVFVDSIDSVDDIVWNAQAGNHLDMYNGACAGYGYDNLGENFSPNARRFCIALFNTNGPIWNSLKGQIGVHSIYIVAKMADGTLMVITDVKIEVVEHTCEYPADGTEGVGTVTAPTCTASGYTTVGCTTGADILCPNKVQINATEAIGHNPSDEWTFFSGSHYHECLNGCGEKLDMVECKGEDGATCDTCGATYACSHVWSFANNTVTCVSTCGITLTTPATFSDADDMMNRAVNVFTSATYEQIDDYVRVYGADTNFFVQYDANSIPQRYLVIRYRTNTATSSLVFFSYTTGAEFVATTNLGTNGEWNVAVVDLGGNCAALNGFNIWASWATNGGTTSDYVDFSHIASFAYSSDAEAFVDVLSTYCEHNFTVAADGSISCSKCNAALDLAAPTTIMDASVLKTCPNPQGGTVTDNGSYVTLAGCTTQMQYIDANAQRYVVAMFRRGTTTNGNGFGVCYYNTATSANQMAFTPYGDGWTVGVIDMKCVSAETHSLIALVPGSDKGSTDVAYVMTFSDADAANAYAEALKLVTIAE